MSSPMSRWSVVLLVSLAAALSHGFEVPGDVNQDGTLDGADLPVLEACLSGPRAAIPGGCLAFDLNADTAIDLADYAILAQLVGTIDCSASATASSVQGGDPGLAPSFAVDGDLSTRWSSEWLDNQWLQIDYGTPRQIDGLTIYWEAAYASQYSVAVSDDAANWSEVFATSAGDGGADTIAISPVIARYVVIYCTQRGTAWGNSILEVELHSPDRCFYPGMGSPDRIDQLIAAMTLDEKVSLLYGQDFMDLHAVPRLGIPSLRLADGPLGIRRDQATAFPAPIALASSWDPDRMVETGEAFGREWINKGRQVMLGPCIGLIRVPHGGRNFETYGEDPFFNARMATAMVQGVQSQKVVACIKHYAGNNQEYQRFTINIQIDERTLREMYLPVFEAAVKEGGAWAAMSAYNRLNGPYCTASGYLQNTILKQEWGFPGFVVSDWGAVHETIAPANAGLDLEMDAASPIGAFWGSGQLLQAVLDGHVTESAIDDKVGRILHAMAFTGILDGQWPVIDVEMVPHRSLVRELAAEGMVLLKNDGDLLPIDRTAPKTLAVIGPNALTARVGGGGSSEVSPFYTVSPSEGLANNAGPNITLVTEVGSVLPNDSPPAAATSLLTLLDGSANGLLASYYNSTDLQGAPVVTRVDAVVDFDWGAGSPAPGVVADGFSVRWLGNLTVPSSGTYELSTLSDDGVRVWIGGQLLIDNWTDHGPEVDARNVYLNADQPYSLQIEYYESTGGATIRLSCFNAATALANAVAAASAADVAVVFAGLSKALESEGYDRSTFDLDIDQVNLIHSVAAANPNTVVIIIAGSQVGMADWIDAVPVVLQAWYPGQEGGNAFADVLFGDVNPAAKLPMTFVRDWADHPAFGNYPGGVYTEGLFVGYRHFDEPGAAAPLFPFGHGLSYTSFALSNLSVDTGALAASGTVAVSVDVMNTGSRSGAEVVQVYVHDVSASVVRPYKELKGFAKVLVDPGATETVTIELGPRAFAYYDVNTATWRIEPGAFEILVGVSAGDIRQVATIQHPGN
jgi:beta-glucosidase